MSNSSIDAIRLSRLITGIVSTQLIFVAAKLALADHLATGPQSAESLAETVGVDASRFLRVLRVLVSLGLVSETLDGAYALTSLGELLRSDVAESQRDFAIMMGSPWHVAGWGNILRSVESNCSAFEAIFAETLFEFLDRNPEEGAAFGNAMSFTSRRHAEALLAAYDLGGVRKVADIGGGHGQLLTEVLTRYTQASGILFDLPAVTMRAGEALQAAGLEERCQIIGGSFFDSVPAGADLYLLKYIIHDWDDERAGLILDNCRRAMSAHAKLLIVDVVLPERNAPFAKTWPDLEMMVLLPNGRERSKAEFQHLLWMSGLEIARIVPTRSELSIIEAVVAR